MCRVESLRILLLSFLKTASIFFFAGDALLVPQAILKLIRTLGKQVELLHTEKESMGGKNVTRTHKSTQRGEETGDDAQRRYDADQLAAKLR